MSAAGPADPAHGFPQWYADENGLALQPCLVNDGNCLLLIGAYPKDPFQPRSPVVFPSNFPFETFYYTADAAITLGLNDALLGIALAGSFSSPPVAPGKQMTLLRINLDSMVGLISNSVFTVTHPYGTFKFTTDGNGDTVNITTYDAFLADDGCLALPCDFDALLPASVTKIGPFLEWDPAVPPAAPAGYIGNPLVGHKVIGSPTGNNFVRVEGPPGSDLDGFGNNMVVTDLFYVQGRLYPDRPSSSPKSKDFGTLKGGTSSAAQSFTIANTGAKDLSITGSSLAGTDPGVFIKQNDTCAAVGHLPPGAACAIEALFAPEAGSEGPKSARIYITSTESAGGPQAPTLAVSLTGVADSTAPAVSSTLPANNAAGVAVNAGITAKFSEALDAASVSDASFVLSGTGTQVTGTVSYDQVNRTALFKPSADLAFKTSYTAVVSSGTRDVAGNPMAADFKWSFTTGADPNPPPAVVAPTVTAVTPANGSADISSGASVSATFSKAMDPGSLTPATFTLRTTEGEVGGNVTFDPVTATAIFTPSTALQPGRTYLALITAAAKDAAGIPMAKAFSWGFTTANAVLPTVGSVSPQGGKTGVAVDATIAVVFSRDMDPATINNATLTLSDGAGTVTGTTAYNQAARMAIFRPLSALEMNTVYTASVGGVKDTSGSSMASDFTWSFTTSTSTIVHPPEVVLTSPQSGAAGVAANAAVLATFSGEMDPASLNSATFSLSGPASGPASDQSNVSAEVAYDTVTKTAALKPSGDLAAGAVYTATISTGVLDRTGNPVQQSYTWSFTVAEQAGLDVSISGTGQGVVTSDQGDMSCDSLCSWPFNSGTKVTLTAVAGPGSKFTGWGRDGCPGTVPCTVVMDGDGKVSALFVLEKQAVLRTGAAGGGSGRIKATPSAKKEIGADRIFPLKARVRLTAMPDPGVKFVGWTGSASGAKKTISIAMDGDKTVIANFGKPRILLSEAELDFGEVAQKRSATLPLTILNMGDAPLKIKGIKKSGRGAGMFRLIDRTTGKNFKSATLPAAGSLDAAVVFRPSAGGSRSIILGVQTDDPHTPEQNIQVTAVGTGPPAKKTMDTGR